MRSRDKVLISLFTATLAWTMLIPRESNNYNEALVWFGSVFSYPGAFITDVTSLWYGGMSLFTIIMIVIVFKAARTADLRAFRESLAELESAQMNPENLLQNGVQQRDALCRAGAARPSLEVAARKIHALQNELSEGDKLLKRRQRELRIAESQMSVLADKPNERIGPNGEKEKELRDKKRRTYRRQDTPPSQSWSTT